MDDNELIARFLFDKQTVLLPTFESDLYRVADRFKNIDAKLVIISFLEESTHQAVQETVFSRMLPRVPEQNSKVIYTEQHNLNLNLLTNLPNATHVLLCGVEPSSLNYEPNVGFEIGNMKLMVTANIEQIDADAGLKKTMWQAWMKQFVA